ncbi:unnamed protein product [Cylindrotheca closterium]|uniref:Uncharacterized protein n=1 Tax=Cylindrotheca closterium TaxID=2856 RepID=A0AAD2FGX5_9STRA|nr:unnamed protein product [Cylindrotheca closterium]
MSDSESEAEDHEEEEVPKPKPGMQWLNEPEEWMQQKTTIAMRCPPQTNFWRKTATRSIEDNAPFYFIEVLGDFEVRVKIKADFSSPDDQAGIMVREDELNWAKCGIQLVGKIPHMCSTVTHDYSDMAMHPIIKLPEFLWVHAKKVGDGLEVYISEDSFNWTQIRQGDITKDAIHQVGLYSASPNSEDGLEVIFEDFMIKDEN